MSLIERDKKVIWHPFTPQKNMKSPIPVTHGKGTLLFDENGKYYIDAISSWWVTLHGHAHPYIAEKLYHQALQLEQVIFAGFTHEPAIALAERLLQILPNHFSKIFYSDNGSTSTEVAIKMALQYWWNISRVESPRPEVRRNKILAFNHAYHGDTFGAMSVSDRSVFTLAFHDHLFEVVFIDTPTKENIPEIKSIIHEHQQKIAAFIYEPLVQGAGGMKMYDAHLMNEILEEVKQQGIICIADEVMTGFGRTGKLFASEHMHHQPDIICLSKGLTGGTMALGVTVCTEKIYNAFVNDDKLKTFFHGHSFTANPLACTAALASMDLLEHHSTIATINFISEKNKIFADKIASSHNHLIKNIRSLGTILAFEIIEGKDEYLNGISSIITKKAMDQHVYIRPLGNTVYIMPPYCITEAELTAVYAVIEKILNEWN
jgi:adenosylmethionine-8-amino-7-oxononanoate aminotransferase